MPTIGVDYGGQANLFNVGQSAGQSLGSLFSGATELKRATAEANINRLNARTHLDEQEYGFRDKVYNSGRDAYLYSHGSSNADPSGANPVPVTPYHQAQGEFQGATYALGTGASDIAGARNRFDGGELVQSTDPAKQRSGTVLLGGMPTRNTVLGPNDNIGTNAEIEINKADVPNKIAIEKAKIDAENPGGIGPLGKNHVFENTILELGPKMRAGTATPEEIERYNISWKSLNPDTQEKTQNFDKTETITTIPGTKFGDLTTNPYAPVVVQPQQPPAPAPRIELPATKTTSPIIKTDQPVPIEMPRAPSPAPQPSAPQSFNTITVGKPQPPTLNEGAGKLVESIPSMIQSEAALSHITPQTTIDIATTLSKLDPTLTYNSSQILAAFANLPPLQKNLAAAALNFVEPILRRKTGAAAHPGEWAAQFNQYLPQGNTPTDIDNARARRSLQLKSMVNEVTVQYPQFAQDYANTAKLYGVDLTFGTPTENQPIAPAATANTKPKIKGVTEIFD